MRLQSLQDHTCIMTRRTFILNLYRVFGEEPEDVFSSGLENGWLEYEDELYSEDLIVRKNVARIIHMYLMKEKGIKDLPSIHEAEALHDLYDCRVCVNHIAQIWLRGIMDAKDLAVGGGFLVFDPDGIDDDDTVMDQLKRAAGLVN